MITIPPVSLPLIIRADASPEIGTGHVMRCLALAEAWIDIGREVIFVSACEVPALETRLKNEGIQNFHIGQKAGSPADADETARIAHEVGADWIVVDGYSFGAAYQKAIKDAGFSLLFIDDHGHADHYYADIVLNQNIYAGMSLYKTYEPNTCFLLGADYVLLRREFLKWSDHNRTFPEVARKILITLGGSDPDNCTRDVIEAIRVADVPDPEVVVVIGGANPHFEIIHEAVKDLPSFRLIKNAENMPELMAWADVAISAGGSTCGELLFMGLPSLVISIAENQDPIVKELQSLGIARVIDGHDLKNPPELAKIVSGFLTSRTMRSGFSERMARYIDGKGPSRIIGAMGAPVMTLRNAVLSDCKRIWQWINDPLVRSVSFSPEPIPLERHMEWFSSALNDPTLVYLIALDNNARPVGQARFKLEAGEAVISVLVDPKCWGRSRGSLLIRDATEKLFAETGTEKVKAFIKTGNEVSKKAFTRAGYMEHGLVEYSGETAYLFIKLRGTR